MKNYTSDVSFNNQVIALINCDKAVSSVLSVCNFQGRQLINFKSINDLIAAYEEESIHIVAVISQSEIVGPFGIELVKNLNSQNFPKIPFFLICRGLDKNIVSHALRAGVIDVFSLPVKVPQIELRLNFIIPNWEGLTKSRRISHHPPYRIPNETRVFDLFFSSFLLILFLPILLLISILIKLESKGTVFTNSLRVGSNYHIFKMLNFRIMNLNADNRLNPPYSSEKHSEFKNNSIEMGLCEDCRETRVSCKFPVFADQVTWCEKKFMHNEKITSNNLVPGLMPNDGLTKIGRFLLYSKLNQLPQLLNVLKGDMSIVGNLPLPLSEAEKLTTDKFVLRFMAPAGITGLWQIEKRKKNYTQPDRLVLDNRYARNHNFQNDMLLLAKTIPALLK